MPLEISIEDPRWLDLDLAVLAQAALSATFDRLCIDGDTCDISLLACDDTRITGLNAEFREKPTPTNVLSWPGDDLSPSVPGGQPRAPEPDFTGEIALGDIAIAYDTCAREAAAAGKPIADHVTHLLVHGLLHLLGYDHVRDADATLMEELEAEILGTMGIDDPYKDPDGP